MLNNPIHPKETYAKTVTSTPKTVKTPFLHTMTILKLTKKNIEKTKQNFPTLEQDITTPDCIKTQNSKLNSTSLNISQKKVIKLDI